MHRRRSRSLRWTVAVLATVLLVIVGIARRQEQPAPSRGGVPSIGAPPTKISGHWQQLLDEFAAAGSRTANADGWKWQAAELAALIPEAELPAFARFAFRFAASEGREELLAAVLVRWSARDCAAAAAWAQQLPAVYLPRAVIDLLYQRLAAADLKAAAEFAAGLVHGHFEDARVTDAVERWASAEWRQAAGWAHALPGTARAKRPALLVVLARAPAHELPNLAFTTPDLGAHHAEYYRKIAADWAQDDPRAALAWSAGLACSHARAEAIPGAIRAWAKHDPAAAAAATLLLAPDAPREQAAAQVATIWAHRDAPSAAAWVAGLADPAVQEAASVRLVSAWAHSDPVAAAEWLVRLPDGRAYEASLGVLVEALAPGNPAMAFRWAEGISSPGARFQAIQRVARRWLARDPAAARLAVERSALPEHEKLHLRPPADEVRDRG